MNSTGMTSKTDFPSGFTPRKKTAPEASAPGRFMKPVRLTSLCPARICTEFTAMHCTRCYDYVISILPSCQPVVMCTRCCYVQLAPANLHTLVCFAQSCLIRSCTVVHCPGTVLALSWHCLGTVLALSCTLLPCVTVNPSAGSPSFCWKELASSCFLLLPLASSCFLLLASASLLACTQTASCLLYRRCFFLARVTPSPPAAVPFPARSNPRTSRRAACLWPVRIPERSSSCKNIRRLHTPHYRW
ncbi:hypothetical protein SAMN02799616_01583 [Paenibacillus sp. UNC499MF]|nr:hypothetical protein SAMN02799616_01583 [Paenibacillus sp. UNC499MF]